jgi:nicotinate-nucleotide adenylyltransferase
MQRIGILGGTFNPVHVGHLAIAQAAQEKCRLDRVFFVPCYSPPHKNDRGLVPAPHRYAMVRLAIRKNPVFAISDFEIKKKGKSYSIDTVRYFRKKFPTGTRFFFILGEDWAGDLGSWHKIDELVKLVTFVVFNRPGHKPGRSRIKYHAVATAGIDVSASGIRQMLQQGQSARYFIPERVRKYIEKNKLYQS